MVMVQFMSYVRSDDWKIAMGLRFSVSSERLKMAGFEPTTPDLEGEQLNHYATEASDIAYMILYSIL